MASKFLSLSTLMLTLGVGGTLTSPAAAQEDEALTHLERAAERYRQTPSFCADFRQELTIPLLRESRSGHGRLCQRQPNLFAMHFTEPDGDKIVADGAYLWAYFPSTDPKQVLRERLGSGAVAVDFHREFLDDPADRYTVHLDGSEPVDGRQARRIVLRPREPAGYQEAVLWIDADTSLVLRVEIREENGSVRSVSLSAIRLDADPPPETFRFTPPPGTQVIGR